MLVGQYDHFEKPISIAFGGENRFMRFPSESEMQTALSRLSTLVTNFISSKENHYTKCLFIVVIVAVGRQTWFSLVFSMWQLW